MKRRIEKLIRARQLTHPHENYETSKLIVLAKERTRKTQFRLTTTGTQRGQTYNTS